MRLNVWALWAGLEEWGWPRVLGAAAGLGLLVFLYSQRDWLVYREFQDHGVPVTGWITAKSTGKDKLVYYAYEAGGKTYGGSGLPGVGTPDFELIEPDERVAVYYLPYAPERSLLGAPKEHLKAQTRVLNWALVIFLPVLGAFVYFEFKRLARD